MGAELAWASATGADDGEDAGAETSDELVVG